MKNFIVVSFISTLFCFGYYPEALSMYQDSTETSAATVRTPFLGTQLEINSIVATTATRIYEKINKNWTYVAPGEQMRTKSALWEPKWIKGASIVEGKKQETNVPTLLLKTTPDNLIEALEDLLEKPAKLECTIALTTAKIFCLKEILGADLFDLYAKAFYKVLNESKNWNIDEFFHELPLQFLKTQHGETIPGSITYITNIPLYAHFKPNGNGRGSNVICTSQDRYLGFSAIYKDGPQPLDAIENQDLTLFIKQEDVEKNFDQHGKVRERFIADPRAFIEMRRNAQKNQKFYQFFDLQEINNYIKNDEIYI